MKSNRRKLLDIFLFLFPGLVIYVVFMLIPLAASLPAGFFDWSGEGGRVFVGLENFRKLFLTPPFNERLFNSLLNNII